MARNRSSRHELRRIQLMNGDHTVFICSENINSVNATCRILQQAWKVKVTRRHETWRPEIWHTLINIIGVIEWRYPELAGMAAYVSAIAAVYCRPTVSLCYGRSSELASLCLAGRDLLEICWSRFLVIYRRTASLRHSTHAVWLI